MLRLHAGRLSPDWLKLLRCLFDDLQDLGHFVDFNDDGSLRCIGTRAPQAQSGNPDFWEEAHRKRHQQIIGENIDWINGFEKGFSHLFVAGSDVELLRVAPQLEAVNFKDPDHLAIERFARLYQSVSCRKLVGRRVGLLIWDVGQKQRRPLMGVCLMSSARYYQPARDAYFGWKQNKGDTESTSIRKAGLDRILQLSVVCAFPPYSLVSGAWLAAIAPFTEPAQEAFSKSAVNSADPDLAAIVTTSGKGATGTPFQRHSLKQLLPSEDGNPNIAGHLYKHIPPPIHIPLRASFRDMVSAQTIQLAVELFAKEGNPQLVKKLADNPRRLRNAAIAFVMRRLGLHGSLFQGNDIGIHVGAIGSSTIDALRSGTARKERLRLDWGIAVDVWRRRNLTSTAENGVLMSKKDAAAHKEKVENRARLFGTCAGGSAFLSWRVKNQLGLTHCTDEV